MTVPAAGPGAAAGPGPLGPAGQLGPAGPLGPLPTPAPTSSPSPPRTPGYLDWASTAPLHPAARAALQAAWEDGWADPTRRYRSARLARRHLDAALGDLADLLGADPTELVVTRSGTDAVHLGVLGAAAGRRRVGTDVVHSAVEHSAVLHAAAAAGHPVVVGVDPAGEVDLAAFAAAVQQPGVALACLQAVNHEVGTVQPVPAAAAAAAAAGVPLLVDAAQAVGRVPLPSGWSLLACSAHKWGGPAGVGLLVVRGGTRLRPPGPVDDRDPRGRTTGYPDVPGVVAAAAALRAVTAELAVEAARQTALLDRLRGALPGAVPGLVVVGPTDAARRAPHLLTVSVLYAAGDELLGDLDAAGIAASSGSSCTASTLEPSHVLVAMGALTHGNLRLSVGRDTTDADIDQLLAVLPGVVSRLRHRLGAPPP